MRQEKYQKDNDKSCLNKDLVRVLLRKISDIGDRNCIGDITVMGYTRATINMGNSSKIILYAHPCFQGNPRYNWVVHFQEVSPDGIEVENYYPSRNITRNNRGHDSVCRKTITLVGR
jgi:hypothetical protein